MATVLTLNMYTPVKGEVHTGTTWLLSKTEDFSELVINEKSTTKLNLATYNVYIPVGEVWYGKAIRHFDNPNYDYETAAKRITNTGDSDSTILLDTDIFVEQPSVFVSKDEILSANKSFTVSSSKFQGNDTHSSSIWIITDNSGDVLFHKETVGTNLESISVDKTTDITDKSVIRISCIHKSALGVESPVGTIIVELTAFNFEITTKLEQVVPLKDLKIIFKTLNTEYDMGASKIAVKEAATLDTYFTGDVVDNSVTIPWYVINPNATLFLEITARDLNGDMVTLTKQINVEKGKVIDIINPEYNYDKKVSTTTLLTGAYIPNGISVEELSNNTIIVPIYNDRYPHKFVLNTVTGVYDDKGQMRGVSLLSTTNEDTYVKMVAGDNLIIDTLNGDNKPCFIHYKYNRSLGTAALVSTYVREEEDVCLGKTNSLVWTSDSTFIYIPVGLNTLKEYNYVTKTLTDLGTIPNVDISSCILFRIPGNRLLIIGGSTYTNYIYDVEDKEFKEGVSTYPGTFVDRDLKAVKLVNGDVLIFKISYKTGDTDNSLLYFDYETCEFSEVNYVFEKDKVPCSSLTLLSGEVILNRYNYKEYWEDKTDELISLTFS